ncbi:MAG: aminodeoxychorismate/anthranilate synthase component II [Deltaproteobacteria bacterium]|nr:aminodeoxychorismate/anthranilate synthase component II [Candidatus Dadabacteria bacterium]TDJ06657.1 MAG: aminodeoxychorismate/anthranilate synthase component II [Deltaproteobacteria bacterium]
MILMLDNYDSFTYNLVHYLGELGEDVEVYRNDKITVEQIEQADPEIIMISPGPCTPKEAGISIDLVNRFKGNKPIFGVCLGHQSIAQAFGAKIVKAKKLLHGKTSEIFHDGKGIYKGIENPFVATRYHSLIIDKKTLPKEFEISAWTKQDEIMGIRHRKYQIEGVQFHPESILTIRGKDLLKNYLNETRTVR